ncbi:MAG: SsrA-binding protein [Candidatus Parcubacteria bacterium]|nr:MAG: SsrA-binding protein [Candidatus Parcubacteria bacterium]
MVIIQNKNGFRNYQILEKYNAGIELFGFEVKSLLAGRGSLKGAYVSFDPKKNKKELFLKNFYIPPYQEKNTPAGYDPYRERKLLLNRGEINHLINQLRQPGLTIIPLRVYNQNRLIKIEIALVKGLKKFEKRELIKKREFERKKQKWLKSSLR